jgi:ceramide glucosyltransferase
LTIIQDVLFLFACASILYYLVATAASILFARCIARAPRLVADAPSVALLKPLHGYDETLLASLDSFFALDYPNKEYVFGVTSEDDPAAEVVEQVRIRYPAARISRTVGDEPAVNRKVGKLLRMLREPPRSEILVTSDADVRVDRDYLRRIVAELTASGDVGMVTCAYRGIAPQGTLGARLEALYLNTDFAPAVFLSYYVEPMRHAFASTIAIRQSTLRAAGGLESVRNSFGDDFALARRVAALGHRIVLSTSIVSMISGRMSLREFWDRQVRWARVDRKIRPGSVARMGINGPFWALLLAAASRGSLPLLGMAGLVIAMRLGMAAWTFRKVLRLPLTITDLALLPFKDLVMQVVWLVGLIGDQVEWSGRKLRLLPTGEMEDLG